MDKSRQKELNVFSSDAEAPKDRVKAFQSFVKGEFPDAVVLAFQRNQNAVRFCFQEILSGIEALLGRGKHISEKEAFALLRTAEIVRQHIPQLMAPSDQRSLFLRVFSLIKNFLCVNSLFSVRSAALTALIKLIDGVTPRDKVLVDTLLCAFNFASIKSHDARFAGLPAIVVSDSVLVPAGGSVKTDGSDSVELLEKYFAYVEESPEVFTRWIDITREILCLLFPETTAECKFPENGRKMGFMNHSCPPSLQACIYTHISHKWSVSDQFIGIFMGDLQGYTLINELGKEVMSLPATHVSSAVEIFDVQFRFFFENYLGKSTVGGGYLSDEALSRFQVSFLQNIPQIFTRTIDFLPLFAKALDRFELCVYYYSSLHPNTQHTLLVEILNATANAVSVKSNLTDNHPLRAGILNTLFKSWITINVMDPDLWKQLYAAIKPSLEYAHDVLDEIKAKLYHVIYELKNMFYDERMDIPKASPSLEAEGDFVPKKKNIAESKSLDFRVPFNLESLKDSKVPNMQWDPDALYSMFYYLLSILEDFGQIKNTEMYTATVKVILGAVEALITLEENGTIIDYASMTEKQSYSQNYRIPVITTFSKYVFSACLTPRSTVEPQILAYQTLCRMFCRRFPALPTKLLSHFYNMLLKGFEFENKPLIATILYHSYNIFAINLSGSLCLSTVYIKKIREALSWSDADTQMNQHFKERMVSTLCSLICVCTHYPELVQPTVFNAQRTTTADIRKDLHTIFTEQLTNPHIPHSLRVQFIWAIRLCIAESNLHWNSDVTERMASALVPFTTHSELEISTAALRVFQLLAPEWHRFNPEFVNKLITGLSQGILGKVTPYANIPATVMTISTWLCSGMPAHHFKEPTLQSVFNAIEVCLIPEKFDAIAAPVEAAPAPVAAPTKNVQNRASRMGQKLFKKSSKAAPTEVAPVPTGPDYNQVAREYQESHPDAITHKEAAQLLIANVLKNKDIFPPDQDVETADSHIEEQDDGANGAWLCWATNVLTVLSVCDIPNPMMYMPEYDYSNAYPGDGHCARLLVRTPIGRYAWDMVPLNVTGEVGLNPVPDNSDNSVDDYMGYDTARARAPSKAIPMVEMHPSLITSQIAEFMATHQNLYDWSAPFDCAQSVLIPFWHDVQETENHISKMSYGEAALNPATLTKGNMVPMKSPKRIINSDRVNTVARRLLQQLGILTPPFPLRDFPMRVEVSERQTREFQLYDRMNTRISHKIGLIYVAEGQEYQNMILANSAGSAEYNDFVRGLGWPVDLETHQGHIGGMDRHGTCGKDAIYWADDTRELIFHEVVRMPTVAKDPQQIQKKKHVGNDFVHVVWCERLNEYNPHTIVSQFNEGHIVIYPLTNGLFRVSLFSKSESIPQAFGPLIHGTVVTKDMLAPMVRETAICVDEALNLRINPERVYRPLLKRTTQIEQVVRRCMTENITVMDTALAATCSNYDPNAPLPPPPMPGSVSTDFSEQNMY